MRITVIHETVYRYESAVYFEPHTFRLRPRHDGAQRLLRHEMEISPRPKGSTECLDQDGNVVLYAWFGAPSDTLAVKSSFDVEMLRENPFDFLIAGSGKLAPPRYPDPLAAALAPYIAGGNPAPQLLQLARSVAEESHWQTLDFITALNRRLFDTFRHVLRDDGAEAHPAEVTLRSGEGSCRDLAVLYCAACRAMGLAARFVSGYECQAAGEERTYMHAWAEVYLPGAGWRGYDPSRGLAVSNAHVAVAAAADARLASPFSGTYRGAAGSRMEFSISLLTS